MMVVVADAVGVAVIVCMAVAMVIVAMVVVRVAMTAVALMSGVAGMALVIVVLAHASFPLKGSAICSSISFSTPLIWASAAE